VILTSLLEDRRTGRRGGRCLLDRRGGGRRGARRGRLASGGTGLLRVVSGLLGGARSLAFLLFLQPVEPLLLLLDLVLGLGDVRFRGVGRRKGAAPHLLVPL